MGKKTNLRKTFKGKVRIGHTWKDKIIMDKREDEGKPEVKSKQINT